MSTYIKLLRGVYGSYTTYCYMTARRIYICFRSPGSIHVVPITGTKRFLLTHALQVNSLLHLYGLARFFP